MEFPFFTSFFASLRSILSDRRCFFFGKEDIECGVPISAFPNLFLGSLLFTFGFQRRTWILCMLHVCLKKTLGSTDKFVFDLFIEIVKPT